MQSGKWRDSYGNPAHSTSVRGVACDSLNQIAVTGSNECDLKFWNFKCKGNTKLLFKVL